jgi:class 3 adenylate cyclase/tetratricopeptide (TPR) repeat protein
MLAAPFEPYVPDRVRARAQRGEAIEPPWQEREPVVVMVADIVGFSGLTRQLSRRGPAGVEALAHLVDATFGVVVAEVHRAGGLVVGFPGDAVIAAWAASGGADGGADALQRASVAAARLLQRFGAASGPGVTAIERVGLGRDALAAIRLRVGLDGGEGAWLAVGASDTQGHVLLASPAVAGATEAASAAAPGEQRWSPSLQRLAPGRPPMATAAVAAAPGLTSPLPRATALYVPRSLRERLDAGVPTFIAELRQVSVMFVRLDGLALAPAGTPGSGFSAVDDATAAVEAAVTSRGGALMQVLIEHDGLVLVAAWGVVGATTEDDATAATLAALQLQPAAHALGLRPSVGIASGRVFAGDRGGAGRREAAVIGDAVNLAARLMRRAQGRTLVDDVTAAAAGARVVFSPGTALRLKGVEQPVVTREPLAMGKVPRASAALAEAAAQSPVANTSAALGLLGRGPERAAIEELIAAAVAGRPAGALVIEGEAGLGKTALLHELAARADAAGLTRLAGAGDPFAPTPYHGWRAIVRTLLGLGGAELPLAGEVHDALLSRLGTDASRASRWQAWAPVLGAVLGVEWPDTPITAQMSGEARATATRELIVELLRAAHVERPALLVIDDAQWLDSRSWGLVLTVRAELPQLPLVIASRPWRPEQLEVAAPLLDDARTRRAKLQPLAPADTVALVCRVLGAQRLADALTQLVDARAAGHPLFAAQLALTLRERGAVQIASDGTAQLADTLASAELQLPDTVQAAITSRFDRLDPHAQLLIKLVAVAARAVDVELLAAVDPTASGAQAVAAGLARLEAAALVVRSQPGAGRPPEFVSSHALVRDVAYGLLMPSQRRTLHAAIGRALEATPRGLDRRSRASLLAYHFSEADDRDRALRYLDEAAEAALRDSANEEALRSLRAAEALVDRGAGGPAAAELHHRLARRRRIVEALYLLGRYDECRAAGREALAAAGAPFPAAPAGTAVALARGAALQTGRRTLDRWIGVGARRALDPTTAERARVLYWMARAAFNTNDLLPYVLANVEMLNATDAALPSRELANAAGVMGLTTGLLGLASAAESYGARAIATARAIGDRPALSATLMLRGLYLGGLARWDELDRLCTEGLHEASAIADRRTWLEHSALLALSAFHHGRLAEARERWDEVRTVAERYGDPGAAAWAWCGTVECLLRRGDPNDLVAAEAGTARAWALVASAGVEERARVLGLRARTAWLRGARASALADAEAAAACLGEHPRPNTFWSFAGYAEPARVFADAAREHPAGQGEPGQRARKLEGLRRGADKLAGYAGVFPLGRARAELARGIHEILRRGPRARPGAPPAALVRARVAAARSGMPYELALAELELARHAHAGEPAWLDHLGGAARAFAAAGADRERSEVLAELEQDPAGRVAATLLRESGSATSPAPRAAAPRAATHDRDGWFAPATARAPATTPATDGEP